MKKKLDIVVPRGRVLQSVTGGYRWKGPQIVKVFPNIQYPDTYMDGAPLIYHDPVKEKAEAQKVEEARLAKEAADIEKLEKSITDTFDVTDTTEGDVDTVKPKKKRSYKKRDTKKIVEPIVEKPEEGDDVSTD